MIPSLCESGWLTVVLGFFCLIQLHYDFSQPNDRKSLHRSLRSRHPFQNQFHPQLLLLQPQQRHQSLPVTLPRPHPRLLLQIGRPMTMMRTSTGFTVERNVSEEVGRKGRRIKKNRIYRKIGMTFTTPHDRIATRNTRIATRRSVRSGNGKTNFTHIELPGSAVTIQIAMMMLVPGLK